MLKHAIENENLNDEEIIKAYLASGSQSYLDLLYSRYADTIYRKAKRLFKNDQDAQDVTHDIFIKVFTQLHTFQGKSAFSLWVHRITYHACIDYLNKKKRVSQKQERLSKSSNSEYYHNNDNNINKENHLKALDECITALNEEDRFIIILKYFDELPVAAIKDILNLKMSAAKMRLKRIRAKLNTCIKNKLDE